jgi:hypothetical protein
MDPAFRDRAPKLVKDKDGKERLLVEKYIGPSKILWATDYPAPRRLLSRRTADDQGPPRRRLTWSGRNPTTSPRMSR